MTPEDLSSHLAAFLTRHHNARAVRIDGLRLLTGGASRQTWSFDATIDHTSGRTATLPLILRADPRRSDLMTRGIEYRLHESVVEAGVLAPRMHANGDDSIDLPFFIMERIEGETIARRLIRDDAYANTRAVLPAQLASILAKIHSVSTDAPGVAELPAPPAGVSPALHEIDRHEKIYRALTPDPHPAFELAFRWLRERAPDVEERRLVHGDYRIGNVIFGPEGVRSILDWELAHIGDPMEDIGWLCVRSWRFGGDKPVGGIGDRDAFYAAYESASGTKVDPERVRFWEAFGNLRWGITCIVQVKTYLAGMSQSVELASIGRRVAETEWELLKLMDGSDTDRH
jgi:aminoglycoside phosphotransferase (APT) family kinase protein